MTISVRRAAKRLLPRALLLLGNRNYFLISGIADPGSRFDHRLLLARRDRYAWARSRDLVTYATIELLAREINEREIGGAVAEVGVSEGDVAEILNHHFADRTLHLFDTFDGFDARDLAAERDLGGGIPYDLPDAPPDVVLSRLPHRELASVHAGWFPDSAAGCEDERFCLVDIDVGLYQPTYAALRWFHPRMTDGGYLLVADYGNGHAKGVKLAVRQFVQETGCAYTVLPDPGARAVLVKRDGPAGGRKPWRHP